jgi:hypothetical protein
MFESLFEAPAETAQNEQPSPTSTRDAFAFEPIIQRKTNHMTGSAIHGGNMIFQQQNTNQKPNLGM